MNPQIQASPGVPAQARPAAKRQIRCLRRPGSRLAKQVDQRLAPVHHIPPTDRSFVVK